MHYKPVSILVVEDDDLDFMSIERTLSKLRINNPLTRAKDGVEAFEILCRANKTVDCPNPMLILLDLNMPRIGGLEFLKRLNADPLLKGLPIVVLTTSATDADITQAYEFAIEGYVLKSDMENGLLEIFADLGFYRQMTLAA